MALGRTPRDRRPLRGRVRARQCDLFDRDGEPPDQPRDLVQIARNRDPRRPARAGPGIRRRSSRECRWERSTAPASSDRSGCLASNHLMAKPGTRKTRRRMSRFGVRRGRRDRRSRRPIGSAHRFGRNGRQIAAAQPVFRPSPIPGAERPISSFASPEALLYAAASRTLWFRLFLGSSAVEHSTVNRMVAGSNPARGANTHFPGLRWSRPVAAIACPAARPPQAARKQNEQRRWLR